jgi:CRISPR/Cas system-associated endoribonuclease Cas2
MTLLLYDAPHAEARQRLQTAVHDYAMTRVFTNAFVGRLDAAARIALARRIRAVLAHAPYHVLFVTLTRREARTAQHVFGRTRQGGSHEDQHRRRLSGSRPGT